MRAKRLKYVTGVGILVGLIGCTSPTPVVQKPSVIEEEGGWSFVRDPSVEVNSRQLVNAGGANRQSSHEEDVLFNGHWRGGKEMTMTHSQEVTMNHTDHQKKNAVGDDDSRLNARKETDPLLDLLREEATKEKKTNKTSQKNDRRDYSIYKK